MEIKETHNVSVAHINHVRKIAGVDHVGIGAGYDGINLTGCRSIRTELPITCGTQRQLKSLSRIYENRLRVRFRMTIKMFSSIHLAYNPRSSQPNYKLNNIHIKLNNIHIELIDIITATAINSNNKQLEEESAINAFIATLVAFPLRQPFQFVGFTTSTLQRGYKYNSVEKFAARYLAAATSIRTCEKQSHALSISIDKETGGQDWKFHELEQPIKSDTVFGSTPTGLEDVSKYPELFAELLAHGWSEKDIQKLAGLNLIRVFKAVEQLLPFGHSINVSYISMLNAQFRGVQSNADRPMRIPTRLKMFQSGYYPVVHAPTGMM
ncbi:Dipeptidase 1 [Acromyrmex echinatior]|uniref:Dipeptidase n=1 Tax=Acromyrmex echinatior TaxID=103372 RepID=F4WMD4_ACREC|nr:Dipeptidase 1 [Acromyrmex echinatior]